MESSFEPNRLSIFLVNPMVHGANRPYGWSTIPHMSSMHTSLGGAGPLVEISPVRHGVILKLAYATPHNLLGRPLYAAPLCLLHPHAAERLSRAVSLAALAGLRLAIFDGYRPAAVQRQFWAHLPDTRYVADPAVGSNHSRGVAIDLTLVDAATGEMLDMGTGFDDMHSLAHHFDPDVPALCQRHRLMLLAVMQSAGFVPLATEWWHYELPDAEAYPLVDDPRMALAQERQTA